MRQLTKAALLGGAALLAGWISWGVYSNRSAESVPYERLETLDGVELRQYPRTVLVETTAPDQITAFRRLFRYISGTNEGDESIAMTAPVQTTPGRQISMTAPVRSASAGGDDGSVRMAFYLPAEYSHETAPAPTESTVRLVVEPPKRLAVRRFSWYAPNRRVRRQERKLLSTLELEGIDTQGDPFLLRYNDPWTPPFMRRNEVAIRVSDAT
jgi:hypothetical protein